jgi:hypothetical protein
MPMLRKFLIVAAGAGALSLAATAPGPAQAGTLHLGSALNSISVESNVIDVRDRRRRRSDSRRHWRYHRGHPYFGFYYVPFWAAPWSARAPHPCYRWSPRRGGWVWRC